MLRAYSPYHNIRAGVAYPAMLVTTADTDDRAVPGHSFSMPPRLQAAEPGGKPPPDPTRPALGTGRASRPTRWWPRARTLSFPWQWTGLELRLVGTRQAPSEIALAEQRLRQPSSGCLRHGRP